MTDEFKKQLETASLNRIDSIFPDAESLASVVSKIAVKSTIITLEEYEKLKSKS